MLFIHPHARSHGVGDDDIAEAFKTGVQSAVLLEGSAPPRWLLAGFDTAGRCVELVVVEVEAESHLAIHAMPARKQTLAQIRNTRRRSR
ncbi:MAG: hypothetical protein LBG60_08635 [Bifidobacteriaceae bacterium]|nr:hypothetical protein [Bifidobacteriaceae bacterium]